MEITNILNETNLILTGIFGVLGYLYKLYKKIKPVISKISVIYEQLTPNGGSSLADKINKIKDKVTISEMRQQIVWANLAIGYYECNKEGECTYANNNLCEMFGLSPEQMKGKGWLRAIDGEEERLKVWQIWQNAIKNHLPYEVHYKIRNRKTQEVINCITTAYTCLDDKNEAIYYFGTVEKENGNL